MYAERIVKRLRLIMGIAVLLAYGTGMLTGFLIASSFRDEPEPRPAVRTSPPEAPEPTASIALRER